MPLPITRGPEYGRCNICGNADKLTSDHTPPKGCVTPSAVELQQVHARLGTNGKKAGRILQDGVKYRTLCSTCNSGYLGTEYDPALIQFAADIRGRLASPLYLPASLEIRTKPQLLMRSVWGHMAALGVNRYLKYQAEEWTRWFKDPSMPLLDGYKFYYWLYPYKETILARDIGISQLGSGEPATYWLMKFYPVAFALWRPQPQSNYGRPFRDLSIYRNYRSSQFADLLLDRHPLHDQRELLAPYDDEMIMAGDEMVSATLRPPRGVVIRK